MLAHEIAPMFPIHTRQVDRTLPLDEPHDLRHRVLRWYCDQHVHMIGEQMPFLDVALLLRGQLAEHLSQVLPQRAVERLAAALGDKHDVVFALPDRVAQTLECVHRDASFRVLGGSRGKSLRWTHSRKCQTATATPAEPGGLPPG